MSAPGFYRRPSRSVERVISAVFWIVLALMIGRVMSMDYHDQQRQAQYQCHMVHEWYLSHHKTGWAPGDSWQRQHCQATYQMITEK